jgi:hypothetical protein
MNWENVANVLGHVGGIVWLLPGDLGKPQKT